MSRKGKKMDAVKINIKPKGYTELAKLLEAGKIKEAEDLAKMLDIEFCTRCLGSGLVHVDFGGTDSLDGKSQEVTINCPECNGSGWIK